MATTTPAGPPVGLLANGAAFVSPEFYNATGAQFAYGSLNDQMKDASGYYDAKGVWVPSGWSSGAGVFAGNNVPKYNGIAGGAGTPASFAGGFALQPANVGGSTAGYTAYGNQPFDPYKGRGNGNGGPLGPPGGGGGPPGSGGPPPGSGGPPGTTQPGHPVVTPPLPPNPPGGTLPPGSTIVPPRTREPGGGLLNYNNPPGGGPTTTSPLTNAGPVKTAPAPGNPAGNWATNLLPQAGSNTELKLRSLAAMQPYDANGQWRNLASQMEGLLGGSNTAMHQANNAYNAGGERYGSTWSINYAAVAQNPEAYLNAGIAKANPDGTYEMLKLQDPESQQWIPIAEWQSKYGNG